MPIDETLLGDAVAYIDSWVEFRQQALRVPGVAIAVAHGDRILLSRAYGCADLRQGTPLTTGHIFRIASHSKTFTATAVLQQVERGTLRLDDRAGDLLEWLPNGTGETGRATVRQLLSHSAGVIRDGQVGGWWDLERDFSDRDELESDLARTPSVFTQNRQFKYSNVGYSLLGLIVERVSGRPYNEYVKAEIVDRLGLQDTGPELDAHSSQRLATGHSIDFPSTGRLPLAHMDTHAMSAATGFYSTAEDLCRYAAAHHLGNEILLTDESKREMQREHWKVEGVPNSYGLGFTIIDVGERRTVGHGGGFPGFITNTKIDPVDQLVVVALTNASDGPAGELTAGMFGVINLALKSSPSTAKAAGLDRFTGRLWSLGGALDIARFGDDLRCLIPAGPNPIDPVIELTPAGGDEFTITRAPGYSSPGERVGFEFGSHGQVERVQWAAGSYYPWEVFQSKVLASVEQTGRAPARSRPA